MGELLQTVVHALTIEGRMEKGPKRGTECYEGTEAEQSAWPGWMGIRKGFRQEIGTFTP